MDANHIDIFEKRLEKFLLDIFSQPYEQSFRRGNVMWQRFAQDDYKHYVRFMECIEPYKKPYRWLRDRWRKLRV